MIGRVDVFWECRRMKDLCDAGFAQVIATQESFIQTQALSKLK